MKSTGKILWIFNLETDLDSTVLAAAHDWVEEFSFNFDIIYVYSTHVGKYRFPKNVSVHEIGGGSFLLRILGLIRLFRLLPRLFLNRRSSHVFHHMSPRTAVILGLPIKLLGIPQGLWYSHSKASLSLRIAKQLRTNLFSSSPGALPVTSEGANYVGHAIKSERFVAPSNPNFKRKGIVSLGRITSIKRLEFLLEEIAKLPEESRKLPIEFVGDSHSDEVYKNMLLEIGKNSKLDFKISSSLDYAEVPKFLFSARYFFSGTPLSVDKAAIEASMSGCLILSDNRNVLQLTGMSEIWFQRGMQVPDSVHDQISSLERFTEEELNLASKKIAQLAREKNDLKQTIRTISEAMKRISK